MRRCARLATEHIVDNGGLYEVLTADEQLLADAAADREQRREQEGYVAPAEAAAFLMEARRLGSEPTCWTSGNATPTPTRETPRSSRISPTS